MAYPNNVLSPGEEIVEHKHPHAKMLFFPVVIGVVLLAGGIWLALIVTGLDQPWDLVALAALGLVGLVVLVRLVLAPITRWRTTHFVVTTERLISRAGLIKRTGVDIPMNRINSVRFEHSLLDRVFGCGTLFVESASEQALEFHDIPSVEKVHSSIYREINENAYGDWNAPDQWGEPGSRG